MKTTHKIYSAIFLLALLLVIASLYQDRPNGKSETSASITTFPLRTIADVEFPGEKNRFDYQSYDPQTYRLFIARIAVGTIVVFDTRAMKIIAEIPHVSQVHGVLVVPELNKIYASATGSNEIVAIDGQTLKIIARTPGGIDPDAMAYAPDRHKLYVSNETGKTVTVIDTKTDKRIATIALGGEAGTPQFDPISKHVFVNVQTTNELIEIDSQHDTIIARHPLAGANHNHGLLIEPSQRLAFIACDGNATLLVLDLQTMKIISTHSVGENPDVLAFDETLRLLYVATESGIVSVFKEQDRNLKKVGEGFVAIYAHSVAVDQHTHRVYFPLQRFKKRPMLRIMEPIKPYWHGNPK